MTRNPICKVCETSVSTVDVVYCARCITPHHRDCFRYNQGCYGCGYRLEDLPESTLKAPAPLVIDEGTVAEAARPTWLRFPTLALMYPRWIWARMRRSIELKNTVDPHGTEKERHLYDLAWYGIFLHTALAATTLPLWLPFLFAALLWAMIDLAVHLLSGGRGCLLLAWPGERGARKSPLVSSR